MPKLVGLARVRPPAMLSAGAECVSAPQRIAFTPIQCIGGSTGWYIVNWLWTVGDWIDLLMGGVSMRGGRQNDAQVQTEDREKDMKKWNFSIVLLLVAAGCFIAPPILAQDGERFALEFEGGALWQTRNDVRIPNATGTEFSLVNEIGKGPNGVFRIEAAFDLNEKHGFRMVFAPLEINETGALDTSVLFAGQSFDPGVSTDATYKFSSYRFTYRYRFYDGPTWSWKIGFTGFIRDARIALRQGNTSAEDTDVGFVPLAHLSGVARLSDQWRLLLDFEGMGAPQGRALDIAAKLACKLSNRWELAFGYRTIEGGADVERVFNFAWLHFAVGSVRWRF